MLIILHFQNGIYHERSLSKTWKIWNVTIMINERKTCQKSDLNQGPFTSQSKPLPGHYDFNTTQEGINDRIALQEGGWWPPPVVWNRQDITLCRIGLKEWFVALLRWFMQYQSSLILLHKMAFQPLWLDLTVSKPCPYLLILRNFSLFGD